MTKGVKTKYDGEDGNVGSIYEDKEVVTSRRKKAS